MIISIDALRNSMKCDHCKRFRTQAGHDPCIANLPGVYFACCGHAGTSGFGNEWAMAYIVEEQEKGKYVRGAATLYGEAAIERMRELGGDPPDFAGLPEGIVLSKYVMERMTPRQDRERV